MGRMVQIPQFQLEPPHFNFQTLTPLSPSPCCKFSSVIKIAYSLTSRWTTRPNCTYTPLRRNSDNAKRVLPKRCKDQAPILSINEGHGKKCWYQTTTGPLDIYTNFTWQKRWGGNENSWSFLSPSILFTSLQIESQHLQHCRLSSDHCHQL